MKKKKKLPFWAFNGFRILKEWRDAIETIEEEIRRDKK